MMNLGEHESATSLVAEYLGVIKLLEALGNKWRSYHLGPQARYDRAVFYRFIDRKMCKPGGSREVATAELQARADAAGKRGTSKAPNWKSVAKALRETEQGEILLNQDKKRTAQENTAKREAKRASKLAVSAGATTQNDTQEAPV